MDKSIADLRNTTQKFNILVIDDDPSTLETFELIGNILNNANLQTAIDFNQVNRLLEHHLWDLVILDIVLPEMNGFDMCKLLKEHSQTQSAYFIMMSGECIHPRDRMRAYHHDAQDFLAKPFTIEETVLMLKSKLAFIQRHRQLQTNGFLPAKASIGHFSINHELKFINKKNQHLALSKMEFALLDYFLQKPEVLITSPQLIADLWKNKANSYKITDGNLRSLIYKVRMKIEVDPKTPIYLVNHKQNGYIFYPSGIVTPKVS